MNKIFLTFIFFVSFFAIGQHQDKIDFTHARVLIKPDMADKSISGKVFYTFEVLQDIDSVWLDANGMTFEKITLNRRKTKTIYDNHKLIVKKKFKKGTTHQLFVNYKCKPKQTVYFIGLEDSDPYNNQVWTQGQGKYTSHWLPSFDDMKEKVEFDVSITFNESYQVISNGKLRSKSNVASDKMKWTFDMEKPMSSYLLAFAIGNYGKQELTSSSSVPVINYYYPGDSAKVEPTYRYTKRIFDFFEKEIDVPYPWQNYKQVPVHDFLYAGMENTTMTIFSDGFMIDSTAFIDKNYVNVNAHELAHQWFGNMVTEEDDNHHWLHEGFATYYAYLAEKDIFGDDYFYWKLFNTAKALHAADEEEQGESLLNPKASSLTFYEKGAWALVMLNNEIGDANFKHGITNYLNKYKFNNVTVSDLITEMEKANNKDLSDFVKLWLQGENFPLREAKEYLGTKNESLNLYFELQTMADSTSVMDEEKLMWLWGNELPLEYKEQFLMDYINKIPDSSLQKIISNETDLKLRQVIAKSKQEIPESLQSEFESFLADDSYITKEVVLYRLWERFPQNRNSYLKKLEGVIGLHNKNVRLLWLTLALVTPEFKPTEKQAYLDELVGYTRTVFNPEVRQTAFQYLSTINALNDVGLLNLIRATNHHSWQFRNFTRRLLDSMLDDELKKTQILGLVNQLNSSDLRYLKTKIELP